MLASPGSKPIALLLVAGLLAIGARGQSGVRGPQPAETDSSAATRPLAFVEDPEALFATGARLAAEGQAQEAKRIFESLIQLYPSLPEPYINLGVLLANEKQTEAAAEAARMATSSPLQTPAPRLSCARPYP